MNQISYILLLSLYTLSINSKSVEDTISKPLNKEIIMDKLKSDLAKKLPSLGNKVVTVSDESDESEEKTIPKSKTVEEPQDQNKNVSLLNGKIISGESSAQDSSVGEEDVQLVVSKSQVLDENKVVVDTPKQETPKQDTPKQAKLNLGFNSTPLPKTDSTNLIDKNTLKKLNMSAPNMKLNKLEDDKNDDGNKEFVQIFGGMITFLLLSF